MEKGSVIVDISNDDPGAIETFHETTHLRIPGTLRHGVVHYCVSNIPGAIAQSTSIAYAAAMLPIPHHPQRRGGRRLCQGRFLPPQPHDL